MEPKSIIIITLIASGLITALFSLMALMKRNTVGARTFMALMLSITFYSWGYALEIYHTDLAGMLFAVKIEYLGVGVLPALWLLLAIKYSGLGRKFNRPAYAGIFLIPVITVILNHTNSWHHLYYRELSVNYDAPFPVLAMTKGAWYYVQLVYLHIAILAANFLYLRMSVKSAGAYRKQALTMLIGSMLPWAGNIIYEVGLSPYGMDINPIFLTVTGPMFFLAMFRFRMFDMVPIARDSIFEGMHDPVLVLDRQNRLADYNPSATRVFSCLEKGAIGKKIDSVLVEYPVLLEQIDSGNEEGIEISLPIGGSPRYYHSNIAPVLSQRSRRLGRTVVLHDVTAQTELRARLQELATVDELTGISNRRHIMDLSTKEIVRAQRYSRAVSLIMMDLDHFKRINDTWGHRAGDIVLKHAASVLLNSLRSCDLLGRYGGEEFVVFLPETPPSMAVLIAQRLCDALAAASVTADGSELTVTASFGVTGTDHAAPGNSIETLLHTADRALYLAKERGRNRVEQL